MSRILDFSRLLQTVVLEVNSVFRLGLNPFLGVQYTCIRADAAADHDDDDAAA